jgi:hypothetical protein
MTACVGPRLAVLADRVAPDPHLLAGILGVPRSSSPGPAYAGWQTDRRPVRGPAAAIEDAVSAEADQPIVGAGGQQGAVGVLVVQYLAGVAVDDLALFVAVAVGRASGPTRTRAA